MVNSQVANGDPYGGKNNTFIMLLLTILWLSVRCFPLQVRLQKSRLLVVVIVTWNCFTVHVHL